MRFFLLSLFIVFLSGCMSGIKIDNATDTYSSVANQISLGDSRLDVLAILEPAQAGLEGRWKKSPESFIKGGVNHFIYYARSGRVADGLKTDDEFTPYSFENDKLVAIGWTYLGGIKSEGKIVPPAPANTQHCYPDGNGGVICNKY